MNTKKQNQKPFILFSLILLLIIFLINAYVLPMLTETKVVTTDYVSFLQQVDNKEVAYAEVGSDTIDYVLTKDLPADFDTSSTEVSLPSNVTVYETTRIDDPDLASRLLAAGVKTQGVKASSPSLFTTLLMSFFPFILIMAFYYFMSRQISKRMGGGGLGGSSLKFGKSTAKIYVPEEGDHKTFADVAGQEEAKASLNEVVDFLHNPKRYEQIGAKCPKGVLLVGPPGTGKTLLAKAVAGEANVPFFSISGSEFVQMFVGMGAAKVRDLFEQASAKAPCIVFIDEIDTIGKKRDGGMIQGSNDEREQTLNQLLTEMDGFAPNKGVVILAATNRPDSLDRALLRPGRFDRRVVVELPDLKGREAILRVHARGVKTDPGLDFASIARQTAGCSGAELANMINEAALRAVRSGRSRVNQKDIEESVDVVLAGNAKTSAVISADEKQVIAYHEVGHALVAASLSHSAPVQKITIVPRTSGALGFTMQAETGDKYLYSREDLLNNITTLTGGRSAEEVVFGKATTGASNDIEKATKIAKAMVTEYGMSDEFGMMALGSKTNIYLGGDSQLSCSDETAAQIDRMVSVMIARCHENAVKILRENESKLHEIARFLLEKETITGAEFMEILEHGAPASGADTALPAAMPAPAGDPAHAATGDPAAPAAVAAPPVPPASPADPAAGG